MKTAHTLAPARAIAFEILRKVEAGGYASDLLLERTAGIDSRDAGLASEIVFGALRFRAQLDYLAAFYSGRKQKLDPEVRIALEMGIYQLRMLERVPAHAVVSDAVELVKRARKTSAAGFVNAVLRKVGQAPRPAPAPLVPPPGDTRTPEQDRPEGRSAGKGACPTIPWPDRETELSCPEWLLKRWETSYGLEAAQEIARAALREPEKFVREGAAGCRVQDIGSQSIVPLLRLEAGQTFLDLCAAPGNKTAQALEAGVRAVACDLHLHRLAALKGMDAGLVVLDGTRPLPFRGRFDRILVDAPCSGTGTLGRNPEIKWRLRPEDLADLHRRQSALLANALAVLAPGGLLVYSTCSLEPEENEEVVAAVPHGPVLQTMRRLPGRDAGDGFYAAVIKSDQPVNG